MKVYVKEKYPIILLDYTQIFIVMTSEITLNNLAGKHSTVISNMYDTATHTTQNWTLRMKEILNLGSHISCKLLIQP